uniref:DNA-directed DNA polymerase n=1 Tax=Tanacetum cinerariifolium TaxID=118510 RepID=A0A6L2N6W2_TANCI|nr:DNA-directed DNA polymerase [Tanacetum cinerariifolium]
MIPVSVSMSLKKILEEDFDALLDEGSKILHSIEGTLLEEEIFVEFNEFIAMTVDENSESESDTEEPTFEKITINTNYKIKTSLEEPPTDLELKPLHDNLEYVFLEEPSFFMLSYHLSFPKKRKTNLYPSLKSISKPLLGKQQTFLDDHLVLNWEKCHFMVKEGIVLGHKVSSAGLEVDKAKVDVISKLPPPTNIKDTAFEFDDECQKSFELLKEKLTCAPVIVSTNWNLPFKLMCDASDFTVEAVLGQKDGKNVHPVYFASETLNPAQQKYTVTEKELMAVVFAFDIFRSYLILSKTIIHTDHSTLRSRWLGPYVVKYQYPSGYVKLYGKDGKTFIVNGHRLKLYHEEDNEPREAVTPFSPKE